MGNNKTIKQTWAAALLCMVFCSLGAPAWAQSSGGEGPHLPGDGPRAGGSPWLSGGGIIRSDRFPDKCKTLTWQVEKARPITLVAGLPDPIYLELCNCRIGSMGTNHVMLGHTVKQGGAKIEHMLPVGQCVFIAATDLTISGVGPEAYGTHQIVANPHQTITVIEKDGD